MKFLSNKILDIKKSFFSELSGLYDIKEIESFLFLLLEEYTKILKVEAILDPQRTVNESTLLQFSSALRKLKKNQPIQYILGTANFYGLEFIVTPDVLIPRPETEELVDLIIKENRNTQNVNILDIGCGSGCIAITLKKNLASANVFALDIFENVLSIAKKNASKNETEINFLQHDILKGEYNFAFPKLDIIVSNPPYVCESEKRLMKKNVLDYEPPQALFVDDKDPLKFYKAIADFALRNLKSEGKIYLEINEQFHDNLTDLFISNGFQNVKTRNDINEKPRILSCNR